MTERKGRRICKCECGGQVRGVKDFGRLRTWCEKCSPVVKFDPMVARYCRHSAQKDNAMAAVHYLDGTSAAERRKVDGHEK